MYNRLLNFINRHKIFNQNQFGFRNNHSAFMALIILVENLVDALDNGNCAVGIFLDFQKAFDTVDHGIYLINCTATVYEELHMIGLQVTCQIVNNQ